MAVLSLALLGVAIFLGFVKKMNAGLICLAFSMVLGKVAGIPDKAIISGFNYSLFLILLGVTYLFSLAQINGSLSLVALKVVALSGKRTYLVPIFVFIFSTFLSMIGPGCVPTMAIMMVFCMSLAAELKIHPAMLAGLVVLSASGGGVSPIAPTGIIAVNLCEAAGIAGDVGKVFLMNGVLSTTAYGIVLYFVFGGYKNNPVDSTALKNVEKFNQKQMITLAGIAVMVVLVMFFKCNVGLTSFAVAAVLSALGVADESEALKKIPWGTLLLIGGVSVYINIIVKLGGIKLISQAMASVMTPSTASAFLGLSAGVLSWVSSTSGVVMPTLIPTVPALVQEMNGAVNPLELATSLSMISHTGGISPLSTGGSLALAAYTSAAQSSPEEQQKLFVQIFAVSACGLLFLSFMAYLGLFRWLL